MQIVFDLYRFTVAFRAFCPSAGISSRGRIAQAVVAMVNVWPKEDGGENSFSTAC
jgi:hypothetical protein